jgi:hypothetical protein
VKRHFLILWKEEKETTGRWNMCQLSHAVSHLFHYFLSHPLSQRERNLPTLALMHRHKSGPD